MPVAASLVSLTLLLLPVGVVVAFRARRDRAVWALALDVPLAIALDLLLVLTLARFMRLELATFVSRALWFAAGVAVAVGVPRRSSWPTALGRGELATAAVGAALGVALSAPASWPYSIFDRKWHTPLVASLRGQQLPFDNVFSRTEALHYHFAGDVHAAMLQALSLDVIHSSWALSLAHDAQFALTVATVGLLFAGLAGRGGPILGLVTALAALLAGPLTIGRDAGRPVFDGYSIINTYSLSFRPHDALADLFLVGFVGAVLARVGREDDDVVDLADTAPALLAATAGLALSDETSLGIVGLSLGLTWLAWPAVVHPRRVPGALLFAGLAAALLGPNIAFAAALAPGSPRYPIALVPWRSPGCYTPALSLATPQGKRMLLFDALPTLVMCVGGVSAFAARRRAGREAILAWLSLIILFSLFALTRLDVNGSATESHRFVSGMLFCTPLLAAALVSPDASPPRLDALARWAASTVALAIVATGALLGGVSTLGWIVFTLPIRGNKHDHYFTKQDLYAIDCRRDLGATLGSSATPHYISKSVWYAYAGCQPTFSPAKGGNHWTTTIGNPYFGADELRELDEGMTASEPLPVVCARDRPAEADPVCDWATAHAGCAPLGGQLTQCTLDAAQRKAARGALAVP